MRWAGNADCLQPSWCAAVCARAVDCSLLPEYCRLRIKSDATFCQVAFSSWRDYVQSRIVKLWSRSSDRCGLMILVRTRGGLQPPIIRKFDEGTRGECRVSDNERLTVTFQYSSEYVPCHGPYHLQTVLQYEHCVCAPELRCIGGLWDF